MLVTVVPMAWRWQLLLARSGSTTAAVADARVLHVVRGGQILPTSIGGDAMRIFETSRRHPGARADRRLGPARARARRRGDARLGASASLLAIGHYDVGAVPLDRGALRRRDDPARARASSRARARPLLARSVPLLARLRLERPSRAVYEAIHSLPRPRRGCSSASFALTLAIQAVRVLAIWAAARRSGSTSRRASTT
jgi:hypothetical protein